jgi:UDP-N-acetylmuramyl pentapeptide synthase
MPSVPMSPFLMSKCANNCEIKQATEVLPFVNFDFVVQGLCLNSQQVQNGDIFVALQGTSGHGSDYIEQAIDKGCVCVLIDSKDIECGVPTIRIDDLSTHLVALAQQMCVRLVNTAWVIRSPAILSWSMPCDDTSSTAVLIPSFL